MSGKQSFSNFKTCLPERIVTYLNEKKVVSLAEAAVLADEFALTHKGTFFLPTRREFPVYPDNKTRWSPKVPRRVSAEMGGKP